MKYIHIESGRYPLTQSDLIAENKSTSPTYPFVAFEGYAEVLPTDRPELDVHLQKSVEVQPVFTSGVCREVWTVVDLSDDEKAAMTAVAREAAKAARTIAVENIKVTTAAGSTFDGDEASQTRMSRAILVLSTGAAATVPWVLADNTEIQADIAELTEALALAGAEQARLWVL